MNHNADAKVHLFCDMLVIYFAVLLDVEMVILSDKKSTKRSNFDFFLPKHLRSSKKNRIFASLEQNLISNI